MSDPEDLRGSAPVYTAKDILVRLEHAVEGVDDKVGKIDKDLAVILSQNLEPRVQRLEAWQNRVMGLGLAGTLLGAIAIGLQLAEQIRS